FGLPVPLQMATTFAAIALGFGVVVGTAISPNVGSIVAAPSPVTVAQAPPPETPATPSTGGGGGGGAPVAAAPIAAAPVTTAATSPSGGGGGGGGGGKKKKKKTPPPASTVISGTVVGVNPVAQSYTLAAAGALKAIHTTSPPKMGDNLDSSVRQLK